MAPDWRLGLEREGAGCRVVQVAIVGWIILVMGRFGGMTAYATDWRLFCWLGCSRH